jgi:CheY-like chemotaxis protein
MTVSSECLCDAQPLKEEWGSTEEGRSGATKARGYTPPGKGEFILFVDNDDSWLWIGQRILSRLGYRMVGYSNPAGALDFFRMQPTCFDLVITDLNMPELDGFELAGRLRQYRPDLPVIMITASETEGISEVRKKGIQRLMSKQELANSLGRTVEEVLTETRAQGRTPSRY